MDVKRIIQERGWTISQVAEQMTNKKGGKGISQSALSQLINGNPTIDKLQEIASIIGVPLSVLVGGGDFVTCPYCGRKVNVELSKSEKN